MILLEDEKALSLIDRKIEDYERHFKEDFPYFEYVEIINMKTYRRLEKIIDNAIENNTPVYTPENYWERVY